MSDPTELDSLILRETSAGLSDSQGVFTLDPIRDLEQMGKFQLPENRFWLLKVVQAAVAGGAASIRVHSQTAVIEGGFTPQQSLSEEEFAHLFALSDEHSPRCWLHLKRALWSLASQKLNFECYAPGLTKVWRFQSAELRLEKAPRRPDFFLRVRAGFFERGPWSQELLRGAAERAFTCSIPLLVNEKARQALQKCPEHGLTGTSAPIAVELFQQESLPSLPLSDATFEVHQRKDSPLSPVQPPARRPHASGVVVVSLHARRRLLQWQPQRRESAVFWVLDGVVIDRQTLPVEPNCIACAVYLSAEGLATDVSGFKLVRCKEVRQRLRFAIQAARRLVEKVRLPAGLRTRLLGLPCEMGAFVKALDHLKSQMQRLPEA